MWFEASCRPLSLVAFADDVPMLRMDDAFRWGRNAFQDAVDGNHRKVVQQLATQVCKIGLHCDATQTQDELT